MSEPDELLNVDGPGWQQEGERGRLEALRLENDRLRATIARMEKSEAFRIGHAITRAAQLLKRPDVRAGPAARAGPRHGGAGRRPCRS